jgi:MFS transporter, DHA1 family, tetracycline resistance protein
VTQENRTLLVVFVTILMDLIGFGIIIPISPFFAESLGATPASITLLGAGYSLMQFLFAPFWGRLSDRVGRRPVILTSIAIATVGYVCFAFAESFYFLFLARLLSGFGTANFGAAQAVIADSTPPERRARGMGLLGAAFGLGFILGPALGGVLGQWGLRVPILAAAVLSSLNWCLAFLLLPETRPKSAVTAAPTRSPLSQVFAVGKDPNMRRLLMVFLVYSAAFSMMEQVLGLFIERVWVGAVPAHPGESAGRASLLTAWCLILVGVTATIVQGGLIGKLVARFGEKRLLVTGCVIVGTSLILIPFAGMTGTFAIFLCVTTLLSVGSGISTPTLSSLLSRATAAGEQGHVMGVGQSLSALGRVIGPACAGSLFEWGIGLPFYIGGTFIVGCSFIAARFIPVNVEMSKAEKR